MGLEIGDRVEWDGDKGTVIGITPARNGDVGEIKVKMDDNWIECEPEWQWTKI